MNTKQKIDILNDTKDRREDIHNYCMGAIVELVLLVSVKIKNEVFHDKDIPDPDLESMSVFLANKYIRSAFDVLS